MTLGMRATSGNTGTTNPGGNLCLIGFLALEGEGEGANAVFGFNGNFLGLVGVGTIGLLLLLLFEKPP